MRERRANPVGRAATAGIPRITLGGLRLAVLDLEQTANFMIDMVFPQRRLNRPLYLTSANGEVLARCSTEPMTDRLFRAADLINADGQPLVTVSRFRSKTPLPERVATTDLFHVVAVKAQAARLTFYMFGAEEAENATAVASDLRSNPEQWLRLADSPLLLYSQPPEIQTQGSSNLELRFTMPEDSARLLLERLAKMDTPAAVAAY